MSSNSEKCCSRCNKTQPLSAFPARSRVCRFCQNARQRERWANDPDYREKMNARRRVLNNPTYREKRNAQQRERRASDPAYREKFNVQRRERRYEFLTSNPNHHKKINTRARTRWANDPEFREQSLCRSAVYKFAKGIVSTKDIPQELREAIILDYKSGSELRKQRKMAKA